MNERQKRKSEQWDLPVGREGRGIQQFGKEDSRTDGNFDRN